MFKKLLSMVAIAGMVFTTSCSSDEFDGEKNGNEVVVSFTAGLPTGLQAQSRVFADGETAKNLSYFVYDENWTYLEKLSAENATTMTNLKATVNLSLINGEKYYIAFWADAVDAPYTFDKANAAVKMNYNSTPANAENRDAFFKVIELTVTGNETISVELKRPFAQLNIGTTDWAAVLDNTNVNITQTGLEVGTYTTLSFKDGSPNERTTAKFALAAMPDPATETFPLANVGVDKYLSMNYILIGDAELVTVTIDYDDAQSRKFTSVPIERNYRTNIYGRLLTSNYAFNVEILPGFDGEEPFPVEDL